jgi:N-acetylglutamate synthase-like GNAT family acetyltransferase
MKEPLADLVQENYLYTCDKSKMNLNLIAAELNKTYWIRNYTAVQVLKSIEHVIAFAVFNSKNEQVAFARVITDRYSFAYLSDVFVVKEERGKGISKKLMTYILSHPHLKELRRFMLATLDAQTLYEQFGFKQIANPERFMEINNSIFYIPENE